MNTTEETDFLSRLVGIIKNGFSTSKKKHKVVVTGNFAIKKSGDLSMDVNVEDGGCAIIGVARFDKNGKEDNEFSGVYARIVSWDETKEHKDMAKLLGRKIKVTIETID